MALVFLRNPSLTTTAVDVELANAGILTARQDWRAREVYPVAQPAARTEPQDIWIEMAGRQSKVMSIAWNSRELSGVVE